MARGWESKSIEQQQEEAARKPDSRRPLTPQQIANENRRRGLLMSREHVVQQLRTITDPRHQSMLEAALSALDKQLEDTVPD